MVGGIGCYAGCNRAVIGQCGGYKGACGRFYCVAHSKGKLCAECSDRKVSDEQRQAVEAAAARIIQEYLAAAKRIGTFPTAISMSATLFTVVSIIIFISSFSPLTPEGGREDVAIAVFTMIVAIFLIIAAVLRYLSIERQVDIAETSRPGFRKFYEKYKDAKEEESAKWNKEMALKLFGDIVLAAVQATPGIVSETTKNIGKTLTTHESPEVLEIRALQDTLKKMKH